MSDLTGGLADLRAYVAALQGRSRPYPEPRFHKLEQAEGRFAGAAGRARTPPGLEQHAAAWGEYALGRGPLPSLRALRSLCWHAPTALSGPFQRYLLEHPQLASGAAIEGLIRSCHARWSEAVQAGALAVAERLLRNYTGRRRLLVQWKEWVGRLLRESGPCSAGADLAAGPEDPRVYCEKWGLAEDSEYARRVVAEAAGLARERLRARGGYLDWLVRQILPWGAWVLPEFKHQFEATVLCPEASTGAARAGLLDLVRRDDRLGDPRLPANAGHWAGMGPTRARVVAWFSQFDITFFFDHVLPRGSDPHGRKAFWLEYVGQLRDSRPLLCFRDSSRLRRSLRKDEIPEFADIEPDITSAFLLDFGKVLVVEFAQTGNACFIYGTAGRRDVVPEFRQPKFNLNKLKQPGHAAQRIVHRPGWRGEASDSLARYGIRP